jgi:hypothetical protein
VAVDFLQAMIHRGQRGVPAVDECYDVVVRGVWRPGSTVRPMAPPFPRTGSGPGCKGGEPAKNSPPKLFDNVHVHAHR